MAAKRRRIGVDDAAIRLQHSDDVNDSTETIATPPETKPDAPKKPEKFERFFELPLEIRDMVYLLVVGEDCQVQITVRFGWKDREKRMRRESSTALPMRRFPESALTGMLVSKQYFSEASRLYVRTRTFSFDHGLDLNEAAEKGCAINRAVIKLARSIKIRAPTSRSMGTLARFPNLAFLEVLLSAGELELDGDGYDMLPWRDEYSDLDLIRLPVTAELLKLRGLAEVAVKESNASVNQTPERQQRVEQLLVRLEKFLKDVITQPRAAQDVANNIPSIYDLLTCKSLQVSRPIQTPFKDHSDGTDTFSIADLPRTEAEFARMFFSRPHALFKCFQDATHHLRALT